MNLIKVVMVPVSIFIVYLLPQYAFSKVPALRKYKGGIVNWFVLTIGALCLINAFVVAVG
ncbi:Serine transporter [compost metagenome]